MYIKNDISTLITALLIFGLFSCSDRNNELKIVNTMLNDTSNYFYTDLEVYKKKDSKLPIGIFDSGTGGLTVFDAIVNFDKYNNETHAYSHDGDSTRDFNEECFIYLADQANMPYGNYGKHDKSMLLKEHVLKDAQFLLSNKYYESAEDDYYKQTKSPIKALVIACNTATAYAKEDIEEFIKKANLDIKVVGVIGAGVRATLENISLNKNVGLAVMATAGTVSSNGYVKEINKQLNQRNNIGHVTVFQQAGIGLAGAIDEAIEFIDQSATAPRENYKGPSDLNKDLNINLDIIDRYNFDWSDNNMFFEGTIDNPRNIQINSVNNYISYHLTSLLEKIIKNDNRVELKSIILGCTHYPFYTEQFKIKISQMRYYEEDSKLIYNDVLPDQIVFIDPALFTAKELYDYLSVKDLFNSDDINNSEFYISVPNLNNENIIADEYGNFDYDFKYGREVNEIQEYVKRIPFNRNSIPENVVDRLSKKIPFTYSLIKKFNSNNLKTKYLTEKEKLK
jgi:glutamate racemase